MIGGSAPSVVADEECLARFILFSNWIRNADQTVKPDAFIPYPYPDLSVTRHTNLSGEALWKVGQNVANARSAKLYGYADFHASTARRQHLKIDSAPIPNNPNHANINGWPVDKPTQKIVAQQLAADSVYRTK